MLPTTEIPLITVNDPMKPGGIGWVPPDKSGSYGSPEAARKGYEYNRKFAPKKPEQKGKPTGFYDVNYHGVNMTVWVRCPSELPQF